MSGFISVLVICLLAFHVSALELKCKLDSQVSQEMAKGMGAQVIQTTSLFMISNESETLVTIRLNQKLYPGFSKLNYDLEGAEAESIATTDSDDGSLQLVATISRELTMLSILDSKEHILAIGTYHCQ